MIFTSKNLNEIRPLLPNGFQLDQLHFPDVWNKGSEVWRLQLPLQYHNPINLIYLKVEWPMQER